MCLKRSRIAWNQFILILGVSLPIFEPPGRPERQREDVSKWAGECLRFWRQIGTGGEWRFLAVLSTELLWLLLQCVSMSERLALDRKSRSYLAPSHQNDQNERKWTIFQKCLKRSGIAWNRFILILRVSLPISGPPGRPERQLEDVSKWAGEFLRFWRQIGTGGDWRF